MYAAAHYSTLYAHKAAAVASGLLYQYKRISRLPAVRNSCAPNKCVNDFHSPDGHSHKVLLCKTAEQQGIDLKGELRNCKGYSMAKDLRKGTKQPPPHAIETKDCQNLSWKRGDSSQMTRTRRIKAVLGGGK